MLEAPIMSFPGSDTFAQQMELVINELQDRRDKNNAKEIGALVDALNEVATTGDASRKHKEALRRYPEIMAKIISHEVPDAEPLISQIRAYQEAIDHANQREVRYGTQRQIADELSQDKPTSPPPRLGIVREDGERVPLNPAGMQAAKISREDAIRDLQQINETLGEAGQMALASYQKIEKLIGDVVSAMGINVNPPQYGKV